MGKNVISGYFGTLPQPFKISVIKHFKEPGLVSEVSWLHLHESVFKTCESLVLILAGHTMEIAGGVAGACAALIILILLVVYRNIRYEQELDSLLWKIDYREIEIDDRSESQQQQHDKTNKVSKPAISTPYTHCH